MRKTLCHHFAELAPRSATAACDVINVQVDSSPKKVMNTAHVERFCIVNEDQTLRKSQTMAFPYFEIIFLC